MAEQSSAVTNTNFFTRSMFLGLPNWALIGLAAGALVIIFQFRAARKTQEAATTGDTPDNMQAPIVFNLPPGVYPFPTPPGQPTPTNPTPTNPTPELNVYPGKPRPDQTKFYTTVAGDTWSSIMNKLFPAGSTNVAALKAWHSSHGGNAAYTKYATFGVGAKIALPAHANAYLNPGHLSVNGNPNA